jgi:peptidoglycan hydrolase-like protein with peptidoglycan-binding domain
MPQLQVRLAQWGLYTGSIGGLFGPETNTAIEDFQGYVGRIQNGIVGEKTYTLLFHRFE